MQSPPRATRRSWPCCTLTFAFMRDKISFVFSHHLRLLRHSWGTRASSVGRPSRVLGWPPRPLLDTLEGPHAVVMQAGLGRVSRALTPHTRLRPRLLALISCCPGDRVLKRQVSVARSLFQTLCPFLERPGLRKLTLFPPC